MALNDLTRISTSGIATGSTIDAPILRKDVSFRGSQVGVTSALFDSSENELNLKDNVKLTFGSAGDLKIYHDSENSYIQDTGTGNLFIDNSFLTLRNGAGNQTVATFSHGTGAAGGVQLHFANSKKFQTTNHGVSVTGILTATSFSGPTNNPSGISTFYDLRVTNNLTVEGTTTTLDTNLIGVDRIEVGANSNSVVGVAITQSGTADILNLYDGSTEIFSVEDGGDVISKGQYFKIENSASPEIQLTDTSASNSLCFIRNSSGNLRLSADNNNVYSNTSLMFLVDGEEKMRIKGDNVGIGSDSPTQALDVKGKIKVFGSDGSVYGLVISPDSSGGTAEHLIAKMNADLRIQAGSGTYQASNANILLKNGTKHIIINAGNAGNVGIGTDNPDASLSISGTDCRLRLTKSNAAANLRHWDLAAQGDILRIQAKNDASAGGGNLFDFYRSTNQINELRGMQAGSYWFVINNDTARVGIGTTNPNSKLEVQDDASTGIIVRCTNTQSTNTNKALRVRNNSDTNTFSVSHKGQGYFASNIGIGTEVPSAPLHISGPDSNSARIKIEDNNNNIAASEILVQNGGRDLKISAPNDIIFTRVSGGTPLLYLENGQNVGIATDNPNVLLDVFKSSNDAVIKTRTTAAGAYFEADSASSGYYGIKLSSSGTEKWFLGSYNSTNFQIKDGGTTGSEVFTIEDGTGKVGIKTTSPTAQLSIGNVTGGYINATGIQVNRPHSLGLQNGVLVYTDIGFNATSSYRAAAFKAVGTGGNALGISTDQGSDGLGGTLNARIGFDGGAYFLSKVGIGTVNPDELLHIFSQSGNSKIVLESDNNSAENGLFWVDEGNNTQSEFYYDHGGNKQNLKVNGNGFEIYSKQTNKVTAKIGHGSGYNDVVVPNGKLGVGTDIAGTTLDVFGNFQVKDGGGRQTFHVTETAFTVAQTNTGWTNTGFTTVPIIKWGWISAHGDHLYFASGGNTPPADQASMILSDQHGFKFGRSGWNGASNTNLSTEYFRITMDGKVGIGTDHPETKYLQVGATAGGTLGTVFTATPLVAIAPDNLGGTAGNSHKIAIFGGQTTGNCSGLSIYHYRRGTGTDWTTDGFSFRQEVDNTANIYEYMNFASGNIGIGENQPNHKLHVKSANPSIALESTSTTGNTNIVFGDPDSETRGRIQYHNVGDYMRFHTGGDESLRIGTKGNMTNATGTWRDASEKFVNTLHMPQSHEGYSTTDSHSTFSVAASMWHETGIRGTSDLTTELFSTRMGGNGGIFVYVEVWFTCAVANYQGYQALWANANRTGSNNFTINNSGQEGNKLGTDTSGYFDLNFTSSGSGANERLTARVTTSFGNSYVRCLYKTTVVGHDYFIDFTTIR